MSHVAYGASVPLNSTNKWDDDSSVSSTEASSVYEEKPLDCKQIFIRYGILWTLTILVCIFIAALAPWVASLIFVPIILVGAVAGTIGIHMHYNPNDGVGGALAGLGAGLVAGAVANGINQPRYVHHTPSVEHTFVPTHRTVIDLPPGPGRFNIHRPFAPSGLRRRNVGPAQRGASYNATRTVPVYHGRSMSMPQSSFNRVSQTGQTVLNRGPTRPVVGRR